MIDIEKLESLPAKQGIRSKRGDPEFYRDHYSVPWNRVNRWLRSKLGQPWDNVISEYVKLPFLSEREKTHRFLADNFVEEHTHFVGKTIYYRPRFPHGTDSVHGRPISPEYSYDVFYVHPKTKLLCFQPRANKTNWTEKYRQEQAKTMRILGDYHQLLKLNGMWYEIRGKSSGYYESLLPAFKRFSRPIGPRDRMIPQLSDNPWINLPDANTIVITYQKQLSSKELKKFGLKNDVLPIKYGGLKG